MLAGLHVYVMLVYDQHMQPRMIVTLIKVGGRKWNKGESILGLITLTNFTLRCHMQPRMLVTLIKVGGEKWNKGESMLGLII